tara:strand:- start:529 stop:861 length:333 start_codon:yes stop_codon:yes gene_type:complete
MSTHKTEIIHQTKRGYVLSCICCRDFQIGFGNMLLVYKMEEFEGFKTYIDSINPNNVHFKSPIGRHIYIKMEDMNFGYCISKEELIELKELLNISEGILQLKEMVAEALQ